MGNYHPHGDSSIYDAMVRMSQWWKQNTPYVDMQGNNGSMDGDPPAAMRYTEARLSKIAGEFLKDIDKDTVMWAPNFDDTEMEPTVLPAKFPNLLVNGTSGISAGYATNIPTHNLGEIIDATIKRIDSPNCYLDTILNIVKGPDFPTGGIVEGKSGIIDAFTTGKGRIIIKSKMEFKKEKSKEQIIITEIPFEVNKAKLVEKIDDIRIEKKIDGISEVRDESDREGLRIVIDLKSNASRDIVLNYLLKNTDLQVSYTYNMVAIVNRRPMTIGIIPILDAYIAHQKEVITRRTNYDLKYAETRMHIVEGLIKALSILDKIIQTIRASKNKSDAIDNLVKEYGFTFEQSKAIVELQLYRLTNMDVVDLKNEFEQLTKVIAGLKEILDNEDKLKDVMKMELRKVRNEYATPRKTEIQDEITEIKIDTTALIQKEDVVVVVTKDGYVKRVSTKSYKASTEETTLKDGDIVTGIYEGDTLNKLLLFTNLGNYLYVPVHELPDSKWKDLGKHISNIVPLKEEETIVGSVLVDNFDKEKYITTFTKNGMVKRTILKEYEVQRYSKPICNMKLKGDDEVITVSSSNYKNVFISTYLGYGLWFDVSEIPITGLKTGGVKAISIKDDFVVWADIFTTNNDFLLVLTDKGTAKRIRISEITKMQRARKGVQLVRTVKTNPYYLLSAFVPNHKECIVIKTKNGVKEVKTTEITISDRNSTGSQLLNDIICYANVKAIIKDEVEEVEEKVIKEEVNVQKIDEQIMTIDDFLKELDN